MSQKAPLAIIGIGCNFPGGAHGPEAFWRLLRDKVDAITEIPADRWNASAFFDPTPGQKGKSIARWGGFLKSIDQFDAAFFGLSPREAAFMDPQQRLLLQAAWEALEDGGETLDPEHGSRAGVFVGVCTNDYSLLQSTATDLSTIDPYTATGTAASIVANRISYCLNLRGPSFAVDTACSSSLVAVHLACTSIWNGECPIALAGGVNVIIGATPFVSFSRSSMLSPDGRCRAFDASANGFVRGEGVGVVAIKPLAAALADGNPIYAVIRATGVNQDGRTNGITVPSGAAQERLVRETCSNAGIHPREVQYVEAHGTGTPVGDPIEAHALGAALSGEREEAHTCMIGSVKTNIGHLEAAAGIAGLIKVALALQHGEIPASLHFKNPSPHIDFAKVGVRVAGTPQVFRNGTETPTAGVNSFGFGGTNAHAILQAAPGGKRRRAETKVSSAPARVHLLPLSARGEESLRALAEKYQAFFADQNGSRDLSLDDICFTAGAHRAHHSHRLCITGSTRDELSERLGAFLAGEARPGSSNGEAVIDSSPVFVCSGQGPQWWGMGRELMRDEPVFRAKIEECDALLSEFADWSLIEELSRDEASSRLHETAIAQPAIFAIQVALGALWHSWGIRPRAIVGHSVGETAAAHLAGVLTLREAARVIFHRGRVMEAASGNGRMLAAALTWEQAVEAIAAHKDVVSVGALNAPGSVTLSGDGAALEEIATALEKRGAAPRFLRVNYAFHSQQMEPVRAELLRALGRVEMHPATIPLFSTVSGAEATAEDFGAEYWWRNVRHAVRFATAIDAILERGHRNFLELSPHPALGGSISECLKHRSLTGTVLASLRRKEPERATMLGALGALHVLGCSVDWRAQHPTATTVRLPSYPWQGERHWHESDDCRSARLGSLSHPFFAQALKTSDPTWQAALDVAPLSYLRDHRIQTRAMFPAAGYVEMALAAARASFGAMPCVVEDLDFQKPLYVPEGDEAARVQFSHRLQDSSFAITSRPVGDAPTWTVHAIGRIHANTESAPINSTALAKARELCREEFSAETGYKNFREVGINYGPNFRGIEAMWRCNGEAVGRIRLPQPLEADAGSYLFHPALLDACFQVLIAVIPGSADGERQTCFLPIQIERLRYFAQPGSLVWCNVRLVRRSDRAICADMRVSDEQGRTLVLIEGFAAQAVAHVRANTTDDLSDSLYESHWKPRPLASAAVLDAPLAPTAAIVSRLQKLAAELAGGEDDPKTTVVHAEPVINELCRRYIVAACEQLGWRMRKGESVAVEDLVQRLGVAEKHRKVFTRMLGHLVRDGLLQRTKDGWKVRRVEKPVDLETFWSSIVARYPRVLPEIALIRRCARELAGVLQDRVDPLKLIFPEGSLAGAEHFYQDSDSFRSSNRLVGEAVATAIARLPEGRTVRILEIGAGTGGMTAYVLPRLPRERTEYVFSDLSNLFFTKAEQKFFDQPFIKYRLLDIEKSPLEQGFDPQSFDIILASDAIHATSDLRRTMSHVRSLLAPQGALVLLEVDGAPRWADLVFGLTDGWWKFTDTDLRPDYPLLDRQRWLGLFEQSGLIEGASVSEQSDSNESRQTIFVARQPRASIVADSGQRDSAVAKATPGTWLVFADKSRLAKNISARLAKRGDFPVTVFAGKQFRQRAGDSFEIRPESPDDLRQMLAEIRERGLPAVSNVVHLWNLDASERALAATEALGCHSVMHLAQVFTQDTGSETPRLWLITRGAQSVERADPVSVAQASVWGLGRVIVNELAKFRCRLIDLASAEDESDEENLLAEFAAADSEEEIAYRGTTRYVARLVHASIQAPAPAGKISRTREPFRIEIPTPGALDRLQVRAYRRRKPAAGEIEIEIKAAALNFRDVLKTLGIYPTEDDRDTLLGDECAGCVTAVGRGVKNFRVGDDVVAIAQGALASHATVSAAMAVHKPAVLRHDEAATMPITFLTAWYALHHLGRMRRGERVLIQAATGGVGLAAIQIAQLAGAEIFATAGSTEKRDFLRALGVKHIMDSRSLAFADQVRELTQGRGVDLVLNSLSGEAIAKGVSCLAPNGRFLEIGKRDVYQNSKLGLRALRHNASLFIIDLAEIMQHDPELITSLFTQVMNHVEAGKLHPLPLRAFQVSQAVNAFRHMSQAKHIGKIVLGMEHDFVSPVTPPVEKPVRFKSDATYLITGGLGGFGLAVAEWLLKNGARHLVLAGRRGAASDDAKRALTALEKYGAEIVVAKADVSQPRDVARVFSSIAKKMPPLRGILHAAMVLDDGVIAQLDTGRFRRVMAPKADGGWHLHTRALSLDAPLDFFVLFSSISAVVGNAGQANYAAANCFLEALAHHRRARGLHALVVSWGLISEIGYVARNAKVEDFLRRHGLIGIKPAEATNILGRLLQNDATTLGVFPVDWRKWTQFTPGAATSPRYSEVISAAALEAPAENGGARESIISLPPAERMPALTAQLKGVIAKVLRTSASKLDAQRPLNELGLDSLMSIELLERIERQFGTAMPAGNLSASTTIAKMAENLLVLLGGAPAAAAPVATNEKAKVEKPHAAPECLVTLRREGSLSPLFCIHAAGGLVSIYEELVKRLPVDRPVFGIQSRALSNGTAEHDCIKALAAEYARLIREKQPRGPYHIAGFSIGGLIAMAVARVIENAGETVAWVGLIDADLRVTDASYVRTKFMQPHIAAMYSTFARDLPMLKPLAPAEADAVAGRLSEKLSEVPDEKWPTTTTSWLREHGYVLPQMPLALLEKYVALFCGHAGLVRAWAPEMLRAPIATWSARGRTENCTAWRNHTSAAFAESVIPGTHYEMMRAPLVDTLAAELTVELNRASEA